MKSLSVIRLEVVKEKDFPYDNASIRTPSDLAKLAREFVGSPDREYVLLFCLNTKNKVNAIHTLSIGSLDTAILSPREVYKTALQANSNSIILAHNHPSGDPTPSPEDIKITDRLVEAGNLIGVDLLDHIIFTDDNFVSLREKGYIPY